MTLLWRIFEDVDVICHDRTEHGLHDAAEPICSECRKVIVLDRDKDALAEELGRIGTVGLAGQISDRTADGSDNLPWVRLTARKQSPAVSGLCQWK